MKEEAEATVRTAKAVLQELVVVVSLVRTLTDSFGSASDLYRKLKQKSRSRSNIREEPERRDGDSFRSRRGSHTGYYHGRRPQVRWSHSGKDDYSNSDDELICTSSVQVKAEYDRGYRKLGEPFARGDLITQNQLQSQIIQLQQTLLNIHQDLLLSTYVSPSSSHSHLARLIQTTRTARAASIIALDMQYQRMLPRIPPKSPELLIPGAFPLPLRGHHENSHATGRRRSRIRKKRNSSSSSSSCSDPPNFIERPEPVPKPTPRPHGNKLFCVYARDLQHKPRLPLIDNFKDGGDNMCQYCHSYIATRPGKAWEIIKDRDKKFDKHTHTLSRAFLVKTRFVIKSHRESGGFACVLCARLNKSDTACRSIGELIHHLWEEHTSDELEEEEDIVEC